MILERQLYLSRRVCLEINRSTKVVLVVCSSATNLADELGISDAFAHLFDVVMFGVFAHVFVVIAHSVHFSEVSFVWVIRIQKAERCSFIFPVNTYEFERDA